MRICIIAYVLILFLTLAACGGGGTNNIPSDQFRIDLNDDGIIDFEFELTSIATMDIPSSGGSDQKILIPQRIKLVTLYCLFGASIMVFS